MAAAALICMTMTSVALISCGGDDDNDNVPSTPKSDNYTTSVMVFSYSVSDDALAVVDFVVEYYDANGKLQSEKMTENIHKDRQGWPPRLPRSTPVDECEGWRRCDQR